MKISEYSRAIADEFGAGYGATLQSDLVLTELDGKTANEALAAGAAPRDVWIALCKETGVPRSRWYGAGRLDGKRRRP